MGYEVKITDKLYQNPGSEFKSSSKSINYPSDLSRVLEKLTTTFTEQDE